MALYDFLEIFYFLKIFVQLMAILFNYLLTEIVAKSFDECQNPMIQFI